MAFKALETDEITGETVCPREGESRRMEREEREEGKDGGRKEGGREGGKSLLT